MDESLTEQDRVVEDGLWVVNTFFLGRLPTVLEESASANSVPAAAVRQRMQALSRLIGRKEFVGGLLGLLLKAKAQLWFGMRNLKA